MNDEFNDFLLSVQTELIGVITPELRAVLVNLDNVNDNSFVTFYYDGEVSEKIIDLWQCAISEATANFDLKYDIHEKIEMLNISQKIPLDGELAYLRKEPTISQEILKLKKNFILPYKEEKYFLENIYRAMQNALVGKVTPNIREIALEYIDCHIYVVFYFEGSITEENELNMKEIMDVFCISFPSFVLKVF